MIVHVVSKWISNAVFTRARVGLITSANRRHSYETRLAGDMVFSNGAMAAGGVVSGRVIRPDGELPPGVLLPDQYEHARHNGV